MKGSALFITVILLLVAATAFGQWTIYDCSKLPPDATPAWTTSGSDEGPTTGVPDFFKVIDDPDVPGNKLLEFNELVGTLREAYMVNWGMDAAKGATVVFRVRPSQGLLDFIKNNPTSTSTMMLAQVKMRNGSVQDDIRIRFEGSNKRWSMKWNRAGGTAWAKDACPTDTTLNKMHIYRITMKNGDVALYIDENSTSVLTGTTTNASTANSVNIGDDSPTQLVGSWFDWVIWDVSGAYAPGQGSPLPATLITGIQTRKTKTPDAFTLHQNYPNPFNPTTEIQYDLSNRGHVRLTVFNAQGQLMAILVDGEQGTGTYGVVWNGRDMNGTSLPSGIYLYKLEANGISKISKMTLMK